MKRIIHIIIILLPLQIFAQQEIFDKADYYRYEIESQLIDMDLRFHTSFNDFMFYEYDSLFLHDVSMYHNINNKLFKGHLFSKELKNNKSINLTLDPLISIDGGYDILDNKDLSNYSLGFKLKANISNKLSLKFAYQYQNINLLSYQSAYSDSVGILNSASYFSKVGERYSGQQLEFYLNYNFFKYFNLKAAYGTNKIGEGYRSLFLSDNASNYPFLNLKMNVWNIKYEIIYAALQDYEENPIVNNNQFEKYAVFHNLSYNVSKRWNISFFESVVWQNQDDYRNRYFDVNYLNPFIFFRPVEFSIGSPDNSAFGLALSFKPSKKSMIYSQLFIDDIIIGEIRNDIKHFVSQMELGYEYAGKWGYWTNKQAFQIGFKGYDIFKIDNLHFQTEINISRPYTYSHRNPSQNYSHKNQSLAHPLASNFIESYTKLHYRYKYISFDLHIMFAKTGMDAVGEHNGQDIFESTYDTYDPEFNNIIVDQYYNSLLQGGRVDISSINFSTSYIINPDMDLRFKLGFQYYKQKGENANYNNFYIFCGITTAI